MIPGLITLRIGLKNCDFVKYIVEDENVNSPLVSGFLWSWNFTVSKRWKQVSNTGATGDIRYMDKMLADFRDFCSNKDGRLKQFWDECWERNSKHLATSNQMSEDVIGSQE